jgi:hypothetical protein
VIDVKLLKDTHEEKMILKSCSMRSHSASKQAVAMKEKPKYIIREITILISSDHHLHLPSTWQVTTRAMAAILLGVLTSKHSRKLRRRRMGKHQQQSVFWRFSCQEI